MRYLLILLFVIPTLSFSQMKGDYDSRLLSKYSDKELKKMAEDSPEELNYLNYYIANCYTITEIPSGKGNAHELSKSIQLTSMDNVNIYDLKLATSERGNSYFKIEGTTKMLMIFSDEQIKMAYNNTKK